MTFPRLKTALTAQFEDWPDVEPSFVDPKRRQRFETLKSALKMYLGGITPRHIHDVHGVTRQELAYYLDRCTTPHADGQIMGYRALIGQTRIKTYVRQTSNQGLDGTGCAGAFGKLLRDFPQVVRIIRSALGGKSGSSPKSAGLHLISVHEKILAELRKAGVTTDQYPFNTASAGYGALCRYVRDLMAKGDTAAVRARFGDVAIDAQMAGTGKNGWLTAIAPLDLVSYDEQALPFFGVLRTYLNEVPIDVPLQRCSLCLLVDECSRAVLGYFISTRRRVCAGDVLAAIEHSLTPWTPKELTIHGVKYRDGAGFPSGVIEGFLGRRIALIKMDNDLTHYANSVVGFMVDRTGYATQYGQVSRWITRMPIEQTFAELQARYFRRIPSTTGSGPADPAVNKPVEKAIRYQIELHELEQIVEVVLANYNAEPRRALYNKSPLERLRLHYSHNGRGSVIPALSSDFMAKPRLPTDVFTCVVRGNQAVGRRPYIELDTAHYTSEHLSNSWGMIGQRLRVLVHGDFRVLRAYRENGEEYSPLRVVGQWSRTEHTRSIRVEINRLRRLGELSFEAYEDPVSAFMEHSRVKAQKAALKGKVSPDANKLAQVLRLAGATEYRSTSGNSGETQTLQATSVKSSHSASPHWRSIFAKSQGKKND